MFTANRLKTDGDQKISRNLNMIKLFYQNKDYTTAKNYVTDLLNLKPNSSEAYKLLSQINEALGEHDQAMKNYKKSLDLKVCSDQNNSFENSYQFTPTKVSSPVVNKNNNHSCTQDNSSLAFDNIEKLFEKKVSIFEKSFESINQQLVQLNENFNKSYEEVSSFKKKLLDMQKKLTLVANKQDEFSNKLSLLATKNDDTIKEQLNSFSINFNNLSEDNCKIIDELYNLKETVKMLCDKGNLSDYDEDESYNDYENEEQENFPSAVQTQQPNLSELFKPSKDTWKCSTCDTPNNMSVPACECCETPNPNSKIYNAKVNGFGNESNNNAKFGIPPSMPSFSFGPAGTQAGTFKIPQFGDVTNSNSTEKTVTANSFASPTSLIPNPSQSSTTNTTFLNQIPSFGNFGSGSLLSSKSPTSVVSSTAISSTFPLSNSSTKASTSSTFSFTGQLNSLTNENSQSPLSLKVVNSNGPLLASNSSVTSASQSSFSFGTKPILSSSIATTAINSGALFSISNSFSFNSSTSKPVFSVASTKPAASNFSFSNVNFSSNLFGQSTFSNNESNNSNLVSKSETESKEDHFEDGGDNAQDGDYFKLPEVKMPDNFEQVTGEEDELVVFEQKSKLFVFKDGEYKERGVGLLKVLKHKVSLKYRILMRRELIFKVCLNTYLKDVTNVDIVDNKFIRFSCLDFSDDKPASGVFLCKFKNVETLSKFKDLIESLRDTTTKHVPQPSQLKNDTPSASNLEVELVYTKMPKPEHLADISSMKLPVNFYDYEDKVACKGCIGCKDEINWNELTQPEQEKPDVPDSSTTDLGLFSSIATDLNLTQNKVDSIASPNESLDNDHVNDQNFVSEKSKLLPQNFELKTGEEDEEIVFNERCKMYHYVNTEWKERGVGNMKILKQKDSNNYRLLMRRDRILNVICNHKISEHVKLEPFQSSNNTLTWFSKDYSEESSGIDELFALKFKNEALMKQFESKVNECIENGLR